MKLTEERGNALVEFISLGLVAQLLIFSFVIRLGVDFRSQLAAESIARQTIRTAQLTGKQDSGLAMARQAASVFGIPIGEMQVSFIDACVDKNFVTATVRVRTKTYVAKGFCLK